MRTLPEPIKDHQGRVYPEWSIRVLAVAAVILIMSIIVAFCNKPKQESHNVRSYDTVRVERSIY